MFTGQRILIARSVGSIGQELCRDVHALGGESVGPAATVSDALDLLNQQEIAGAISDEYLQDGTAAPLVLRLWEQNIPFVLLQTSRLTLNLENGGHPARVLGGWMPPFHILRELEAEMSAAPGRQAKGGSDLPVAGPRHLKG